MGLNYYNLGVAPLSLPPLYQALILGPNGELPALQLEFGLGGGFVLGQPHTTIESAFAAAGGGGQRLSAATLFDADGVMQTADQDVPRFADHDENGVPLGVLIEGGRTNLLLRSDDFSVSPWSSGYAAIVPNAELAVDGTMSASKIAPINDTLAGGLIQGVSKAGSAQTYTFSIFAKPAEFNRIRLYMSGLTTTNATRASADFDLLSGTIVVTNAGTETFTDPVARVESVGDGWYRVSLSVTSDTHTSISPRFYATDRTATVGDGSSGIYVWGAQVELGPMASSYIPTTASAVTRAADQWYLGLDQPWFDLSEGTMVALMRNYDGVSSSSSPFVLYYNGSTNYLGAYRNNVDSRWDFRAGGAGGDPIAVTDTSSGYTNGERTVLGLAWEEGGTVVGGVNGVVSSELATGELLTPSRFGLGARYDDAGTWDSTWPCHIERVVFFPRKLNASQLQAVMAQVAA